MYLEDDILALSGIQHFAFCRRQWALIHLEKTWKDNVFTALGEIMHKRAHNESTREKRDDTIIVRDLSVFSWSLGITGKTDVVEFHHSEKGHPLFGEDGLWIEHPIEYKRGATKVSDVDRLQLCAEALCLEEMLGSTIDQGFIFYGATKSRECVKFTPSLIEKTIRVIDEMHQAYRRGTIPKAKLIAACKSCSLKDVCLPETTKRKTVASYLKTYLDSSK